MSVRGVLISTDSVDSSYEQYQDLSTTPKIPKSPHSSNNPFDKLHTGKVILVLFEYTLVE